MREGREKWRDKEGREGGRKGGWGGRGERGREGGRKGYQPAQSHSILPCTMYMHVYT